MGLPIVRRPVDFHRLAVHADSRAAGLEVGVDPLSSQSSTAGSIPRTGTGSCTFLYAESFRFGILREVCYTSPLFSSATSQSRD